LEAHIEAVREEQLKSDVADVPIEGEKIGIRQVRPSEGENIDKL
jgi:hypothetical protein